MRRASAFAALILSAAASARACPSYGSLPPAPADYAQASQAFDQYRASKTAGIRDPADLPFLRTHGAPTPNSILLVHGLTDSPYYMATLADAFYAQGYNVVSVLLPGHGTSAECLRNVRASDWRAEVAFGMSVARRLGAKVSLAGFSTGGALSLDAVLANYDSAQPAVLGDLFLFSPAIGFDDQRILMCDIPGITKLKPWKDDNPGAPATNPYHYVKMATNGVCQLKVVLDSNARRRSELVQDLAANGVGVFAVESMSDTMVSPSAVVSLIQQLSGLTRDKLVAYPKQDKIAHGDVTRPETNPRYDATLAAMIEFMNARTTAFNTLPAAPPLPVPSDAVLLEFQPVAGALAP